MERVAFLIEKTGERITCLLNPETLIVKRTAGIRHRAASNGPLTGVALTDDPLIYTGGGSTELTLDLLFDTSLLGSSSTGTDDVRTLTRPLCDLAENTGDPNVRGEPRCVRLVWGKAWNVPGVIAATAERLEFFTEGGIPRRSWLRMRLLRVNPSEASSQPAASTKELDAMLAKGEQAFSSSDLATFQGGAVEVTGGELADNTSQSRNGGPTRLDGIAQRYFGKANLWRLIAWYNNVDDPLHIQAGTLLQLPTHVSGAAQP